LHDSDLASLENHLMICEACRERLDEIADFAIGMRDASGRKPASRADWFGWLHRPAISMAVVFVALIVVIGIFSKPTTFAPSASLQLTAMRGEMPFAVPAREFDLTLADGPRSGGPFRVEVVNAMGASIWRGLAESSPGGVQVKVSQRLTPGDYFVRLYSVSGQVLREYGFRIRV
jgi:hypothetical protein